MTAKPTIDFITSVSKFNNILNKRLDSGLGWLWYSEFLILRELNRAPWESLKRIDLADKLGFSASGITRLLQPMEKIWLINKEKNEQDARVSLVILAPGWKMKLEEATERAELILENIIDSSNTPKIWEFKTLLDNLWWKLLWN